MNTRKKNTKRNLQSNPKPSSTFVMVDEVANPKLPPGARVPASKLRKQAVTSFDLGVVHEEGLLPGNWTPERNLGLKNDLASYDAAFASWRQNQDASLEETVAFQTVIAESASYRSRMSTALGIITKKSKKAPRLRLSGTQKSGEKLGQWFEEVLNKVENYKAALVPFFGADPVASLNAQATKLMSAMGTYTSSRSRVASLGTEQRAARIKLAQSIQDQRMAAMFAFEGNAEVLKQFVPVWTKKKSKAQTTTATPASPLGQAEAGAPSGSDAASAAQPAAAAADAKAPAAKPEPTPHP